MGGKTSKEEPKQGNMYSQANVKLKLPVLVFSYLVVQPPFDINSPSSLGYIVQSTYGAQKYQTCTDTAPSRNAYSQLRASEIHFIEIHFRPV